MEILPFYICRELNRKCGSPTRPSNYSIKQTLESAFHNLVENIVDNHVDIPCKCVIIAPLNRIAQGLSNY